METVSEILPEYTMERHCDNGNCAACEQQRATPILGGAATYVVWTDHHACTVVGISPSGKTVLLRRDKAKLLNAVGSGEKDALEFSPGGFVGHTSGRQRYAYEADPNGEVIKVTARKLRDGSICWKAVGQRTNSPGGYAYFGVRCEHYDYNF